MVNGQRVMVVLPAYNAGKTLERTVPEDVVLEKDALSAEGLPPIRADGGKSDSLLG